MGGPQTYIKSYEQTLKVDPPLGRNNMGNLRLFPGGLAKLQPAKGCLVAPVPRTWDLGVRSEGRWVELAVHVSKWALLLKKTDSHRSRKPLPAGRTTRRYCSPPRTRHPHLPPASERKGRGRGAAHELPPQEPSGTWQPF